MEPFYFGSVERRLFGFYHAPESGLCRDCGVVICYPIGHEYIQCHRALQQLAVRLAEAGFPVLRFDFFACGDSAGSCEDGRISEWQSDVSQAIDEIRRKRAVPRICMIGLRLGATLAAIVGGQRRDIEGMVLWDPVLRGSSYIQELRALHVKMLQQSHVKPRVGKERQTEFLGFPFNDLLLAELAGLDLVAAIQEKPAENVLIIESNEKVSQETLEKRLKATGARVEYRRFPTPEFWTWMEDLARVMVPYQVLKAILSWVSRTDA